MPTFSTRPDDGKVDDGKSKKGDFVAKSNDLAALLFPDRHLYGLPTQGKIVELSDSSEAESESTQEAVARRQLDCMIRADAAEQRAEANGSGPAAEAGPGPSSVAARLDRMLADQQRNDSA